MIHSACEYMLYAQENGIQPADITFIPAKAFSPYMECLPANLNQIELKENRTIEVNPNYHYEEIFTKLLTAENQDNLQELQKFIFDFWIHEVFEIERLAGMTKQSFARKRCIQEILQGSLGDKYRQEFESLTREEQDALMGQIYNLYSGGDGRILFGNALRAFLSDIYVYMLENEKILLYIGEKETYMARRKIALLQDIFLPMGIETDIFWNKHFGVFEIEETMVLDEIALI